MKKKQTKKQQKKRLFAERFEHVPIAALVPFQQQIRDKLHKRHGIYALYNDRELQYVGLAKNLRGRIFRHLDDHLKRKWNSMSLFLTSSDKKLREL